MQSRAETDQVATSAISSEEVMLFTLAIPPRRHGRGRKTTSDSAQTADQRGDDGGQDLPGGPSRRH